MGHQNKNRVRQLRQSGEEQIVFVYGSLKEGFSNYERTGLASYACLATAFTVDAAWDMRSYGGFPVVVEGGESVIMGEIYVVDDYMMSVLDYLEGFPKFYDRRKVAFQVDSETGEMIEAWMYFHPTNSDYSLPESTDGIEIIDGDGVEVLNWVGFKSNVETEQNTET